MRGWPRQRVEAAAWNLTSSSSVIARSQAPFSATRNFSRSPSAAPEVQDSWLNVRLQVLADRAGVPYTDGKKVTSRSWRAGAKAGRWTDGSHTADTVYDRHHVAGTNDPLNTVPL
ncbi:hypothetical protein ACFYS7_38690 [Streptomyces avermitilis]|uniref:hypothetical protein n=1 Tax=Streptomyces avermitilis TaxID=33903 RepID=UPI0036CF6B52